MLRNSMAVGVVALEYSSNCSVYAGFLCALVGLTDCRNLKK
jgi:hypothetical protein